MCATVGRPRSGRALPARLTARRASATVNGMRVLVAAALALAAALTAAAPAQARLPAGYVRISDERTFTSWSYIQTGSVVRATASRRGRRVGRVHTVTWVGSRDVVIILGRWREWSRVRYPRLGAQVGWVPTRVLSARTVSRALIIVDRRAARLRAYRRGRLELSVGVGVGAAGSPTPAGRFYIRERVLPADRGGVFGVLALGLSAYSRYRSDWPGGGQVAIHGTNEPRLIPGRISNGCVRLRNRDVRRLGRIAGIGTPVRVR